jgi:hypothetical protein
MDGVVLGPASAATVLSLFAEGAVDDIGDHNAGRNR